MLRLWGKSRSLRHVGGSVGRGCRRREEGNEKWKSENGKQRPRCKGDTWGSRLDRVICGFVFGGAGVGFDFAVDDYGDVAAAFEELHDVFAFAGHDGPAGFGGGILFQAAKVSSSVRKIDLF